MRLPSLRAPLDILFLICCLILTADVLGPEIFGHGKTKDYPLWFWAGQQVLHGGDLYPQDINGHFNFLYPPLSAILKDRPQSRTTGFDPGWQAWRATGQFEALPAIYRPTGR